MRVFLSSTSEDLKPFRLAAAEVVRQAQWYPIGMEDFPNDPRRVVDLCRDTVRTCDLVLLFVAFRHGWAPAADQGGDGQTSITTYEVCWHPQPVRPRPRRPTTCPSRASATA